MSEGNGRTDADDLAARVKRAAQAVPLPKRFYKDVTVDRTADGFAVRLDGKSLRTPGRAELVVPRKVNAEAIASEWRAVIGSIDPKFMPLTRLVNSAIDGVRGQEAEVVADCAKYAGTDLLCYRADFPVGLAERQTALWDPPLAWAEQTFACCFIRSVGVMHVTQPEENAARIADAVCRRDAFALAGLQSMTTLMGSVLLALACADGHLAADQAWTAAHVDEDWQISQWGQDTEAAERRANRWADFQAAAQLAS